MTLSVGGDFGDAEHIGLGIIDQDVQPHP